MKYKKEYKFFRLVRTMPELYHKKPSEKYVPEKSEVFRWLSSPEVIECLFQFAYSQKLIKYNSDTGKWYGAKDENVIPKKWEEEVQKANQRRHEKAQQELANAFDQLSTNGLPVISQQIAISLNIGRSTLYNRVSKSDQFIIENGMIEKIKRSE
ncbi:hypothetical protein [Liquorilactobacillus satsumensis]|uniref:hypothetical protein n=1 Tax=Liquorilactobacillus satsumensis TaxID=259059 RepID=UPI0021C40C3B|nr:hypothetical protein [Liquorilactobacillus satsumensis]MCP9357959.1 hypothetical protein [Liquorilactobacillus satsumensis]MCP9371613.1 hypothetical protein [Liquorilactobacillus satsumensis]